MGRSRPPAQQDSWTAIEAEITGFLHRTRDAGTDYPIGTVIGVLVATREEYESLLVAEE
jgi:hypothetical protein